MIEVLQVRELDLPVKPVSNLLASLSRSQNVTKCHQIIDDIFINNVQIRVKRRRD
jgi:hypothetical protein